MNNLTSETFEPQGFVKHIWKSGGKFKDSVRTGELEEKNPKLETLKTKNSRISEFPKSSTKIDEQTPRIQTLRHKGSKKFKVRKLSNFSRFFGGFNFFKSLRFFEISEFFWWCGDVLMIFDFALFISLWTFYHTYTLPDVLKLQNLLFSIITWFLS